MPTKTPLSSAASLPFKGHVTEQTTEKGSIVYHVAKSDLHWKHNGSSLMIMFGRQLTRGVVQAVFHDILLIIPYFARCVSPTL